MSLQLLCLHTKFCQNPPLTASSLNNNKPWGLVLHQHFNFLMKNWPSFFLACEHPKPISLMPCYTTKGNNGACNSNLAVPARARCHFDLSCPGRVCCSPIPLQRQVSTSQIGCKGDFIRIHWCGGCREVYATQRGVETIIAFLLRPLFLVKMANRKGKMESTEYALCAACCSSKEGPIIQWHLSVLGKSVGPSLYLHILLSRSVCRLIRKQISHWNQVYNNLMHLFAVQQLKTCFV